MATKVEIVKQFIAAQAGANWDALSALLADDVSQTTQRGTVTGKQALVDAMKQQAAAAQARGGGGMGAVPWTEPVESGDVVSRSATTPMGSITMKYTVVNDKISKIEMAR